MKRPLVTPNTIPSKRRICRELIDLAEIRGAGGDNRLIFGPAPTSDPSKGG